MHTFTDKDLDRNTTRHLASMNSKPWYAIVLDVPNREYRTTIQRDLDRILETENNGRTRNEQSLVYFTGQYSPQLIERVRKYLSFQEGIVTKKILRSEKYGLFVGNPKHWLKNYAGFSP